MFCTLLLLRISTFLDFDQYLFFSSFVLGFLLYFIIFGLKNIRVPLCFLAL